jgi:hypothetical protein
MSETFEPLVASGDKDLRSISDNVEMLRGKMAEKKALESSLQQLKNEIAFLELERIPDLMFAAGVKEFTTVDGAKVALKSLATAKWPEDPEGHQRAIAWLETTDNLGVVKVAITAEYAKGEFDKAWAEYQRLRGDNSAKVELKESVHYQTLQKLMREALKEGIEVDPVFNLFVRTQATIKEST